MSNTTFESLWLIVALLPGFISVRVRDFFLPPQRRDVFERWFEVIAFALANYCLAGTSAFVWRWVGSGFQQPPFGLSGLLGRPDGMSLAVFLYELSWSSMLLGACAGWVAGHDLHYRFARHLGLTRRTGRDDVWQDVFADIHGTWHLVHLADGRRAVGVARYFSDRGTNPSVYLSRAAWLTEEGVTVPVDGDGILIAEAARIQCVEFISGEPR